MSTHICGCDPEARHHCGGYPNCAWGNIEAHEAYVARTTHAQAVPEAIFASPAEPEGWSGFRPEQWNDAMTMNAFQSSIARTYKPDNPACHGLGIAGETGEVVELGTLAWLARCGGRVADLTKKVLFHNEPHALLDHPKRDDMRKELGDVLWYIAAIASDWGFTLGEVAQANIDKLAKRYPRGFEKGGGVRGPEGSAMNESLVKQLREGSWAATMPVRDVNQRAEGENASLDVPTPGTIGGINRSVVVGQKAIDRLKPMRISKQTFRALQGTFSSLHRENIFQGRPTLFVCDTVFEEGDE